MEMSSFLIIGNGAMACFFAARLAAAGFNICMTDEWQEGIQTIQQNGIKLITEHDTQTQYVNAIYPTQKVPVCKYALVLVKSWQNVWAAHILKQSLQPGAIVITLQNGLGNNRVLKEESGIKHIYSAVTTLGATLVSAGVTRAFDQGDIQLENAPALQELTGLFKQAGFNVLSNANIDEIIWGKLVVNAVVNPLTALLEVPNGRLLELPQLNNSITCLVNETLAVAKALNINLPYSDPFAHLQNVLKNTAGNHSSMYQDMQRSAPTEIDQINGEIVRLGIELGVPTPSHTLITGLIKAKAAQKMMEVT